MYVVGDWIEGNVGNLYFWWLTNIHPPPDREMAQGPAGVIDIVDLQKNLVLHHADLQQNSGVHHNEIINAGVHIETENSEVQNNMNAPHNYHNDPPNDLRIKI